INMSHKWIIKALLIFFVVMASIIGYVLFFPMPIPNNNYQLIVNKNESVASVAADLYEHDIIKSKFVFTGLLRLSHKDRKVVAGLYFIKHSMSLWGVISRITNGKPDQISITIIDGWSTDEIRNYVNNLQNIQHLTAGYSESQLKNVLRISYPNLEGAFYPSTYFIAPNQTDLEIYQLAYRLMKVKVESYFLNRSKYTNYANPYQLLIMASLIQKETNNKNDMQLISTVFNNRLKRGMKLQDDPSVFYGLKHKAIIGRRDFLIDTPYNTYLHNGLPITPICTPSDAALLAASQATNESQLLYFVAIGLGKTKFSSNFGEHKTAINKYLKK
ncbi:MAG: endolytic transglycosylase MltG, partial [Burkholderiales bacterium]|nr:endolytic transglycosylase MltG [Burkholderiales bacterium]